MKEYPRGKHIFKFILVGDASTGKTSFTRSINNEDYTNYYNPTLGVDFVIKLLKSRCGLDVKCYIWDTAGQEQYNSITRTYFKGCCAAILMFDTSDLVSFNNLDKWIELIENEGKNIKIILVGNKIDKKRVINNQIALDYANQHNMQYFEISSNDINSCNNVIENLVEEMMIKYVRPGKYHEGITYKSTLLDNAETKRNCCSIS